MKTLLLTEFPAGCNFRCEYCYIKPDDPRRQNSRIVTANDYHKFAEKLPDRDILYWFCSIGEPLMYPGAMPIIADLSQDNAVVVNTNLAHARVDQLLQCNTENIGVWWSIHWDELKRHDALGHTLDRLHKLREAGITVWPMMLAYPSYMEQLDEILAVADNHDFIIKITHYRDFSKGRGFDGLVQPAKEVRPRLWGSEHTDPAHWNASLARWQVNGAQCTSGLDFLVVDCEFNVRTCGGKGGKVLGKFPDAKPQSVGTCRAPECPCSLALMHGVNSRHDISLADVFRSESGKLKTFFGKDCVT